MDHRPWTRYLYTMKTDLTTFSQMPDDARVWVYQSSRTFTDNEVAGILRAGQRFMAGWEAHGTQLNAAFDVLYNRFIILAEDGKTAQTSGCSIDGSVAFIKQLGTRFNVELLDRLTLAYLMDERIEAVHINRISERYADGSLRDGATVFNNMIASFAELKNNWRIPLKDSWAGNRVAVGST